MRFGEGDYDSKENDVRTLLGVAAGAPRAATAGADSTPTAAQTPEIHFGLLFGGDQFNSSPEKQTAGAQTYSLPDPVPQNSFALSGQWTATDQGIEAGAAGSMLALRYQGGEVNLVAGAAMATTLTVELDGAPLTTLDVMEHDLYRVIEGGPSGFHTLTFRTDAPGVQLFAFTFGAGAK